MTPLESSHGHHLPTRAASARAARGRCFDPKRAATAPGCRACSASPEHHRAISRLIVGQDQTQAHSSSSTRGSSTTPDDGSHIHRIVRPRCRTESSWLRAGRVWACTRPLQSVHAAAELVCRGRVVVLVSYVMSTAAVGRVILDYCIISLSSTAVRFCPPHSGLPFLMRLHKTRSTRDRSIPRSLQRRVSMKSSISQLPSFCFIIIAIEKPYTTARIFENE